MFNAIVSVSPVAPQDLQKLLKQLIVQPANLLVGREKSRGLVDVNSASLLRIGSSEGQAKLESVDLLSKKPSLGVQVGVARKSQTASQVDLGRMQLVEHRIVRQIHGGSLPLCLERSSTGRKAISGGTVVRQVSVVGVMDTRGNCRGGGRRSHDSLLGGRSSSRRGGRSRRRRSSLVRASVGHLSDSLGRTRWGRVVEEVAAREVMLRVTEPVLEYPPSSDRRPEAREEAAAVVAARFLSRAAAAEVALLYERREDEGARW